MQREPSISLILLLFFLRGGYSVTGQSTTVFIIYFFYFFSCLCAQLLIYYFRRLYQRESGYFFLKSFFKNFDKTEGKAIYGNASNIQKGDLNFIPATLAHAALVSRATKRQSQDIWSQPQLVTIDFRIAVRYAVVGFCPRETFSMFARLPGVDFIQY